MSKNQPAKRFGFVQKMDDHPQRRLMNVLETQGMQASQQITFLSDGADNVRDLQYCMHPESEHLLDWFPVVMKLTVLNQFAKGMMHTDADEGAKVTKALESAKWYLWHGNVEDALDRIEDCIVRCHDQEGVCYANRNKLLRHLEEFDTYIRNNQHLIPNYGEKWRYGETISTSFVESTINEVVAKRMVKKQQMQWTHEGVTIPITNPNGGVDRRVTRELTLISSKFQHNNKRKALCLPDFPSCHWLKHLP